jgi:nucleotide-binding universal stress UspA family protein
MKTILVPTDFSENADRALIYACNLALKNKAKIILMNSYQAPATTTNVMVNFTTLLEEDSIKGLDEDYDKIREDKRFDDIEIIKHGCYGYLSDAIKKAGKEFGVDLVVMGTAGSTNLATQIFGSNTTEAIKNTDLPIIVVPSDTQYSPWKNITFASNIQESKNDCPFETLKDLTRIQNCRLHILTVVREAVEVDKEKVEARIASRLTGVDYDINVLEHPDVSDGILNFINENDTDLLVLIKKDYGFIEGLVHSSVTRKLALHANKPMLLYKACE